MNIELRKELEEQQSTLGLIEKSYIVIGGDIPSDYFENMESRFFEKLKADAQPKEAVVISFWERTRVSYAVAAVCAIAVVGLGLFSILRNDNISTLSQNEVVKYLEEEDEWSPVDDKSAVVDLNYLSKEEIKAYLIEDEGIDLTSID